MSLELQENISSFVDNELDASACDELLLFCDDNDEQKQRIARYGVISAAIKGDVSATIKPDFLAGIHAKLAEASFSNSSLKSEELNSKKDAEVVTLPIKPAKITRFSPAFGYGIAATVTLAAVLGFQMFTISEDVTQSSFLASNIVPETQTIHISTQASQSVAVVNHVVVELPTVSESRIYAEQSIFDDGQWTRITPSADTPLQRHSLVRHLEGHVPFVFQPKHFTFARSVTLDGRFSVE